MIIELDNIVGKCEFFNNICWSVDITKTARDFNCNAVTISLIYDYSYSDTELFKKILGYIFSKKYIQENYVALGIFDEYIDFVNNDYYKRTINKYEFYKNFKSNSMFDLLKVFHKFIDYELMFNKDKYIFRGAVLWDNLKCFDYKDNSKHTYGENAYSLNRYLIDKNCIDDFVSNFMKLDRNENFNLYCKNNSAVAVNCFNDNFVSIEVTLKSIKDLTPLYEEIQEDFKHLNITNE